MPQTPLAISNNCWTPPPPPPLEIFFGSVHGSAKIIMNYVVMPGWYLHIFTV